MENAWGENARTPHVSRARHPAAADGFVIYDIGEAGRTFWTVHWSNVETGTSRATGSSSGEDAELFDTTESFNIRFACPRGHPPPDHLLHAGGHTESGEGEGAARAAELNEIPADLVHEERVAVRLTVEASHEPRPGRR